MSFTIERPFPPGGDQQQAIHKCVQSIQNEDEHLLLWGVTGSGKTYTMANVIQEVQKVTLVVSHNKTLAAQLACEMKTFFPNNAVEYFVSYYDYYRPEAYIPQSDVYIEKDASINDNIDRLRLSTTHSLLTRSDVIIVSSVSCLYGLGCPEDYQNLHFFAEKGQEYPRKKLLKRLISMRYKRNDTAPQRGQFSVHGDSVDIILANRKNCGLRLHFWGDELEEIYRFDSVTGEHLEDLEQDIIYPASHYAMDKSKVEEVVEQIEKDLEIQLDQFQKAGRLVEYQRLKARVEYDVEMILETGFCQGIENYARYFCGSQPGDPPYTLLDYLPPDSLIIIDESHVTLGQISAMYAGDYSRKKNLVHFGFRLPAAYDNRPLKAEEFWHKVPQCLFVSATPGLYEQERAQETAIQEIRPTGLLDPVIEVLPLENQVQDICQKVKELAQKNQKALVLTLTKKMAEDLNCYFKEQKIATEYLHSDIDALERVAILKQLRSGDIDVCVGINLLREGIDLPEVSLVAILDADKEGFLRNETSLLQMIGRAARHVEGKALLYADRITKSIQKTIQTTQERRLRQEQYNLEHNIQPKGVFKEIKDFFSQSPLLKQEEKKPVSDSVDIHQTIEDYKQKMYASAEQLDFEQAALYRDIIAELQKKSDAYEKA